MAKQGNNNDRVNNSQRAVLAKLAEQSLDKKLQQARADLSEQEAQIKNQLKEELGVADIDRKIEAMQEQVAALKKEKERLGFDQYRDAPMSGSEAKKLFSKRMKAARQKVDELEDKKADAISGIWTSRTLSQALGILESVKTL